MKSIAAGQIVTLTNLYTSSGGRLHGWFGKDRMGRVAKHSGLDWQVLCPVPRVPLLLRRVLGRADDRVLAAEPVRESVVSAVAETPISRRVNVLRNSVSETGLVGGSRNEQTGRVIADPGADLEILGVLAFLRQPAVVAVDPPGAVELIFKIGLFDQDHTRVSPSGVEPVAKATEVFSGVGG
mgnify:CR=1 FL=1